MPPKYTEIVSALQARIDREFYAVGALLPSEAQLTREFATSRSTVVRALRCLGRQGWLRGMQGRGRVVLGRPVTALATLPHRVQFLLQADRHAAPMSRRRLHAPPRLAGALAVPTGSPLVAVRYLLELPGIAPFGVSTVLVPAGLAAPGPGAPEGGLLAHLEEHHGRTAHRVVERLGARQATEAEAKTLVLDRRRSVAVALLTVLDAVDEPFLAVDAVLSRAAPDLVATYEL